ncbi:flagellar filament outer layer protein Flaa domain protein [Leptospira fainei serovar Hurstbridge str. BUT 6]|uniref:Flagellar filament outer layer protein Flaa domain protein n=1 Tax=Leptospira fainei serovar Hurstbridge str. BUT 6 TaxID=1193011 RepID=S3W6T4_9LEPT|nr:flagellar filament outer layer protein FlaA [Leptospira fainei]EPG75867.1 flagellar filament outer layer protein Flaa domain protein [Leptospira fainei serovar Hurstbridge str. BUT 6]
MARRVLFCLLPILSIVFIPANSSWAPPITRDQDEASRVLQLEKVLGDWKHYNLFLVDAFEGSRPWEIYRGISFINRIEFTSQIPSSAAFLKEKELYKEAPSEEYRSMMIHSFFENPKEEHLEIRPKEPIRLPIGIPIRIFFWAYSSNHNASIEIVFRQRKSKEVRLEIGDLKFEGWKRIETKLSVPGRNIRLNQSLRFPLEVSAIRIKPSPFQPKGEFVFYLDRFGILIDNRDEIYPGAEIKDNWGTAL